LYSGFWGRQTPCLVCPKDNFFCLLFKKEFHSLYIYLGKEKVTGEKMVSDKIIIPSLWRKRVYNLLKVIRITKGLG
jgi:hypothetical protein